MWFSACLNAYLNTVNVAYSHAYIVICAMVITINIFTVQLKGGVQVLLSANSVKYVFECFNIIVT